MESELKWSVPDFKVHTPPRCTTVLPRTVTAKPGEMIGMCSVTSSSLWPRGLQPARLLCPRDSPGDNARVGCHFLLQRYLLDSGVKPTTSVSPALAGGFFTTEPHEQPKKDVTIWLTICSTVRTTCYVLIQGCGWDLLPLQVLCHNRKQICTSHHPLGQRFSKSSSQTHSLSINWELVISADSQASPQTYWIRNSGGVDVLPSPPDESDAWWRLRTTVFNST